MAAHMVFWRNNRIDGRFTMPHREVAELFIASTWADVPWPLDRKLRAFLTDNDGPIGATWNGEADYDALYRLVGRLRRRTAPGSRGPR